MWSLSHRADPDRRRSEAFGSAAPRQSAASFQFDTYLRRGLTHAANILLTSPAKFRASLGNHCYSVPKLGPPFCSPLLLSFSPSTAISTHLIAQITSHGKYTGPFQAG